MEWCTKVGKTVVKRKQIDGEAFSWSNPIMAGRLVGWCASDHKQCHRSPLRRLFHPEPSLFHRPLPFHSLASAAPVPGPVPVPGPSLCSSEAVWEPENVKRPNLAHSRSNN